MTEIDTADAGTEFGVAEARRGPCLVNVTRRRTFVKDYFANPKRESQGREAASLHAAPDSTEAGVPTSDTVDGALPAVVELVHPQTRRRAYTRRALQPDFLHVDQQITRGGMTLSQLHRAYCEQGVGRRLYGYSRFCALYAEWAVGRKPTASTSTTETINPQR